MPEITLLDGAEATGAGDAHDLIDPISPGAVQAVIDGTATVKLQGSLNGSDWTDIATFTGNDAAAVDALRYVRGNVTEYTSGAVSLILGVR